MSIKARPNETIESMLRRFKKELDHSGKMDELKRREYFIKPSQIKHNERRIRERRQKTGG